MKTFYFTLLFTALVSGIGFSQPVLPPVYEIKSDTFSNQNIDASYWLMLEDKEGKLTVNDVTTLPVSDRFHKRGVKPDGVDTLVQTYWFKYRIKNTMNREAHISLRSKSEYDDFYLIAPDGNRRHFLSGTYVDWEKKDGLKSINCISTVFKPLEEQIVYQRIHNDNDIFGLVLNHFAVQILGTEAARQEIIDKVNDRTGYYHKTELQEAFDLGLLFLAFFLNFFCFRIVRDKVYLYFALFAFFLFLNRLWNIVGWYCYWENPGYLKYVPYLGYAWAFIPYYLIQFFRTFFQVKSKYPRWDKWLYGFGVLNISVRIIDLIVRIYLGEGKIFQFFHTYTPVVSNFIIPLSIIITFLLYIRSSEKSFRYVIFGALSLMILYVLIFPFEIHIRPDFVFYKLLRQNFRLIEVICISWLTVTFTWVLFMQYAQLRADNAQKALDNERLAKEKEIERNQLIEAQKVELEKQVKERTAELTLSLKELKATQNQLIQSEKLASLGELTAGIAHEIQNPLNFVNNFSELSVDLTKDLNTEITKKPIDEVYVKEIMHDLTANQEKINLHGKRASSIVKGMLEHSRASTGKKELTDINKLADEYFRLSYHGLRAKNKDFNAEMITHFDTTIPKIEMIPQDIGRVIVNLINNAFYAVNEKRILDDGRPTTDTGKKFEPTVTVSTKKLDNAIEIRVKDNGTGMSEAVRAKVFQPFFTTKPTGQGTGLGLSLAYDIITKGHGGTLKVESTEGVGSEFIILLPV